MSYSLSHWSGRLGNNIQQVANCIMLAEKNGGEVNQHLDHDIIGKFSHKFGDNNESASGRFYAWEPLAHCDKGIFEGGNEIGMDRDYVYENIRRVCKDYLAPHLKLPEKEPIGEDTIVMHLRSGDMYFKVFERPINYVPNPLIFYTNLIESFDKCILITEEDRMNPVIHELEKIDKVQIQISSVEDDFATLMSAKNLALSGVGTFAMGAALCSSQLKNLYTTDLLLSEHLNYSMFFDTDVKMNVMELENYIPVYPCSWSNSEEQRQFVLDYR